MLRRYHHFLFYKVLFKWKMDFELHQYLCSIYEDEPMSFHKDLFIWLIGGWDWNKLLPAESSWYKLLSHNSPISWISWSYSRSWSYQSSMLLYVKFPYITCPSCSTLPSALPEAAFSKSLDWLCLCWFNSFQSHPTASISSYSCLVISSRLPTLTNLSDRGIHGPAPQNGRNS